MRLALCALVVFAACGPDARTGGDGGGNADTLGPQCVDGTRQCLGSTYQVCAGGQWTTQEDCTAACDLQLGCVACIPDSMVCEDGNVHSCTAAGEVGPETEACTGSNICQNGACVDACAAAAMTRSYTGCEYWAVDLDNAEEIGDPPPCTGNNQGVVKTMPKVCMNGTLAAGGCDPPNDTCPAGFTCQSASVCVLDAQHAPFAIVVSNPQSRAVDVTVTPGTGTPFTASVPAGQVQALMPQAAPHSIADQSIDGGGIQKKAYKVTSTLPIIAYQFNPLDNANVFSNDASLLIPRTAFDVEYYAITKPSLERRAGASPPERGSNPYLGYIAVVAWQDGTVVEVTPTVATLANGTPAIAAGVATMFTLNAHDVLSLQAAGTGDLTGTRIRAAGASPTPIGVFAGHEATVFGSTTPPSGLTLPSGPCCADHLEDMMFPTSTWGKTFAITRSQVRIPNYADPDLLRIMAQKPGTTVTFSPAPTGTCNTLGPGQYCEVSISADTVITANEPILVGHFLQADIWQYGLFVIMSVGEGDPSMAIAVPTEQFRNDYNVLVPSQYAKNFLSIAANMTGAVTVDGAPVTLTPNGMYRAARVPVTAGPHKISCPGGCGVEVYGYGPGAVSYMFAGGLDLKQIVIQ